MYHVTEEMMSYTSGCGLLGGRAVAKLGHDYTAKCRLSFKHTSLAASVVENY